MSAEMSENIARGADIFPSERPNRSSHPTSPPQENPFGQQPASGVHAAAQSGGNPVQAANLMSPVGQQYPQQVDWAEAAAMPAKALPPWMLGALFVAAIFGALIVTIIIAKIVH
jgi:hypothetical protein